MEILDGLKTPVLRNMDRESFEKIAQPGDLVLIITHGKDRASRRVMSTGIYARGHNINTFEDDPNYGSLLHYVQHLPPWQSVGVAEESVWSNPATPTDFYYKEVVSVKLLANRNEIGEFVGQSLDEVAERDYRARFP